MIYLFVTLLWCGGFICFKEAVLINREIPYHYLKNLNQLGLKSNTPFQRLKRYLILFVSTVQGKRKLWRQDYINQLEENLSRSGTKETAIEFKIRQYSVPLLIVSIGFFMSHFLVSFSGISYAIKFLSIIGAYAAFQTPTQELSKKLREKRDCIILELPRFIRTIRFSPDHKPMIFIIKDYLKVARGGLKYDFEMIVSDMETNFTEQEALMRFSNRAGITEVKELCMAINLLEGGSRGDAKIVLLLIENKLIDETKRIMQCEMNKRPERLAWVNEVLLYLLGFLFIIPVGLSVWESVRQLLI